MRHLEEVERGLPYELVWVDNPALEYLKDLHGTKMAMYWAFTAHMQDCLGVLALCVCLCVCVSLS